MNSLNIISARVSPSSSPVPSRSNSLGTLSLAVSPSDSAGGERNGEGALGASSDSDTLIADPEEFNTEKGGVTKAAEQTTSDQDGLDETTPLLAHHGEDSKGSGSRSTPWHLVPRRIANTLIDSIRWVLSTLAAPGVYLIACLYDENGNFAPLLQLRKVFGVSRRGAYKLGAEYDEGMASSQEKTGRGKPAGPHGAIPDRRSHSSGSSSSGRSSESDSDQQRRGSGEVSRRGSSASSKHARSKSLHHTEEIAPSRRSIRIKLHPDDSLRQRKHRKTQSASPRGDDRNSSGSGSGPATGDISAQLKSPTSPVGALTKYPKTPAPPRPLIPRRQPSYLNVEPVDWKHQKTLILDLDETLIHSMSKGGRMSTGHMVEVRLATTYVGVGGQATIGPQHPILYYVHKRPHCDDFLRRVRFLTGLGTGCPSVSSSHLTDGAFLSRCASGITSSCLRRRSRNTQIR